MVAKLDINNIYKRRVYQYTLDGKLYCIWNSIKEIKDKTGYTISNKVINSSKPSRGYVWRDANVSFFEGLDLTSIIVQLDKSNNIIEYYDSFLSAAKALGKNSGSSISQACR